MVVAREILSCFCGTTAKHTPVFAVTAGFKKWILIPQESHSSPARYYPSLVTH